MPDEKENFSLKREKKRESLLRKLKHQNSRNIFACKDLLQHMYVMCCKFGSQGLGTDATDNMLSAVNLVCYL
jgi:hypothetical protein